MDHEKGEHPRCESDDVGTCDEPVLDRVAVEYPSEAIRCEERKGETVLKKKKIKK
jgi:hypothetical protein